MRREEATTIPYVCGGCGAEGVRLWRQSHTFLDSLTLLCVTCGCSDQEEDRQEFLEGISSGNGDQIWGLVPAVLTPDGASFWGYTSVPSSGVEWWYSLPLGDGLEAYEGRPPINATRSAWWASLEQPNAQRSLVAFGDHVCAVIEHGPTEWLETGLSLAQDALKYAKALSNAAAAGLILATEMLVRQAAKDREGFLVDWREHGRPYTEQLAAQNDS